MRVMKPLRPEIKGAVSRRRPATRFHVVERCFNEAALARLLPRAG